MRYRAGSWTAFIEKQIDCPVGSKKMQEETTAISGQRSGFIWCVLPKNISSRQWNRITAIGKRTAGMGKNGPGSNERRGTASVRPLQILMKSVRELKNVFLKTFLKTPPSAVVEKADLVTCFQAIHLIACFRTMKNSFIWSFIIKIIDRNGIGITVITINSQNTAAGTTKQRFCERLPWFHFSFYELLWT